MNTYIALACLLAVAAGNPVGIGGYGWGGSIVGAPIYAPAISTANLYKAAPISVVRPISVVSAPILKSVATPIAPIAQVGLGGLGGLGYGYGGLGWGKDLGLGLNGLGWNAGWNGLGGWGGWGSKGYY